MKKMISESVQLVPTWNPQRMMMDFEKATINASSKNFPALQLTGCFFHMSQSILRFLQVRVSVYNITIFLQFILLDAWFETKL